MSLILGGCTQCMFVIGSLLPTFAVDQLGHRNPLMSGSAALAVSMMLIAVLLSFQAQGAAIAKASASFFFIYMLFFGGTANCIPWVYVPEILPLHVRAKGTVIGLSANWIWNLFGVMVTPMPIANLKWKAYLIFMATNLLFIPLVYYAYPETTCLTLEQVDYLFVKPGAVKRSLRIRKYGWDAEEAMDVPEGSVGGSSTPTMSTARRCSTTSSMWGKRSVSCSPRQPRQGPGKARNRA